jgi:hypothetical protein
MHAGKLALCLILVCFVATSWARKSRSYKCSEDSLLCDDEDEKSVKEKIMDKLSYAGGKIRQHYKREKNMFDFRWKVKRPTSPCAPNDTLILDYRNLPHLTVDQRIERVKQIQNIVQQRHATWECKINKYATRSTQQLMNRTGLAGPTPEHIAVSIRSSIIPVTVVPKEQYRCDDDHHDGVQTLQYSSSSNVIPDSFDWRTQNSLCVSKIRSQSNCGACWAFTGAGVIQDRVCILTKGKYANATLSPQQGVCPFIMIN